MNLENAASRADQIARQFLAFGEIPEVSRLIAKIEAVEATNVGALANRMFRGGKPALSAVGQLSGLTSHEAIIARFT
jgi:predicted Zn-dependent peptidase